MTTTTEHTIELAGMGIEVAADMCETENESAVLVHALVQKIGLAAILAVIADGSLSAAEMHEETGEDVESCKALRKFAAHLIAAKAVVS